MQFIRKSTSALVQKAKPAVVEILVYDRQNRLLKAGTGFFISADGKLLTNYHVIAGGRSVVAKPTTGDLYQLKDVVAASERADAQSLLSGLERPKANLSRAIQSLNVRYSIWFNKKYQRVGPCFREDSKRQRFWDRGSL